MSRIVYAGIGSRRTPDDVLEKFVNIAKILAENGLTLRSGGADGADQYFEIGCNLVGGDREIYLPWENFNNNKSAHFKVGEEAIEIAKQFHPKWDALSEKGKLLIARNSYQVLGLDLKTPSDFIICWTENGEVKGGTGQALRIAKYHHIPVYNFGCKITKETVENDIFQAVNNIEIFL